MSKRGRVARAERHQRWDYGKGDGHVVSQYSRRAAHCDRNLFRGQDVFHVCDGGIDDTGGVTGFNFELSTVELVYDVGRRTSSPVERTVQVFVNSGRS